MHSSISIANKLLSLAEAKKATLTPMQLMKLVYLCHGWMLGINSRHLVKEPIEAWLYGPVIPDLYQVTKHFKSGAVTYPLSCDEESAYDDVENNLIKEVYEKYGIYTGPTLSALTHQVGSPWHITWHKYGKNAIISNDLIEEHYNQLAKKSVSHLT